MSFRRSASAALADLSHTAPHTQPNAYHTCACGQGRRHDWRQLHRLGQSRDVERAFASMPQWLLVARCAEMRTSSANLFLHQKLCRGTHVTQPTETLVTLLNAAVAHGLMRSCSLVCRLATSPLTYARGGVCEHRTAHPPPKRLVVDWLHMDTEQPPITQRRSERRRPRRTFRNDRWSQSQCWPGPPGRGAPPARTPQGCGQCFVWRTVVWWCVHTQTRKRTTHAPCGRSVCGSQAGCGLYCCYDAGASLAASLAIGTSYSVPLPPPSLSDSVSEPPAALGAPAPQIVTKFRAMSKRASAHEPPSA